MFSDVLGRRMVYAADEYYLMADRPFPSAAAYDGFPMHEDGIGMARTFEAEFAGLTDDVTGVRRGFFAAVDVPPNPTAYTSLRTPCRSADDASTSIAMRPRRDAAVGVLTGELGAEVIAPLIASLGRDDVRILPVRNEFFGGNTGVTGLITGEDVAKTLVDQPVGHRYLLPDVCLSDDGRVLDGYGIDELPRTVEVVATDGAALRRSLERR